MQNLFLVKMSFICMRMKSFSYQFLLPAGLFAIKLIDSLIEEVFVGLMDELID